MSKNKSFVAFLDTYDCITARISKRYYDGKSSVFYLRDEQMHLQPLQIKSIEDTPHDEILYHLQAKDALIIGREYELLEEHASAATLHYGLVTRTARFDEEFTYYGPLGYTYTKEQTLFMLWAPTANKVYLHLERYHQEPESIALQRQEKGVYTVIVSGDLHLATYSYVVRVSGEWREVLDPYGKASTCNAKQSVIVDFKQLEIDMHDDVLPPLRQATDAILYEMNIRDFTAALPIAERSTYDAAVMRGLKTASLQSVGIQYLQELGITHVQIMPMMDFYTVDECNQAVFYNWGYDPLQWMVPEGSYAIDPYDPLSRIRGVKQMVSAMHGSGIRVNMDVVFNHMYRIDLFAWESIVPNYFFRMSDHLVYSNGSFCGNDFDSERLMAQKYIIDTCTWWIEQYHIDGFRFDLMGITDISTMNTLVQTCNRMREGMMFYGEGWNMPTMLAEEKRATMYRHTELLGIAFFNDRFRDTVKGPSGEYDRNVKGYCSGDTSRVEAMKAALTGSTYNYGGLQYFTDPKQSINYVECHDNGTCWDKMKECCKEDDREMRMQRQKLIIGVQMVSQGIVFLHSGQEFCRTKNGMQNTYCSKDSVNALDWERKDRYHDIVAYTKDMIALRKRFACLRYAERKDMEHHIELHVFADNCLRYQLKDIAEPAYEALDIYINPTGVIVICELDQEIEILANESGLLKIPIIAQRLLVQPASMVVCGRKRR